MAVRVETKLENIGLHPQPARVLVYEDDKLIAEVIVEIVPQPGADGGIYPFVKFTKNELVDKNSKD